MNASKIMSYHKRTDFLSDLVRELINRRIQFAMTQEELNDHLGLSEGHLAKWETGRRTPTTFNLHCWADALGCRLTIAPLGMPSHSTGIPIAANDNEFKVVNS